MIPPRKGARWPATAAYFEFELDLQRVDSEMAKCRAYLTFEYFDFNTDIELPIFPARLRCRYIGTASRMAAISARCRK